MKEKRGPHAEVKAGNVTIPIYHSKTSRGYDEFKVVWKNADGKRLFKTFADLADAKKHAGNINAAINKGDINTVTLANDDRLVYLRAKDALRETGVPLDRAAAEFAYAIKKVGAEDFRKAIDYYAAIHRGVEARTVQAVVDDFLKEKETPSEPNIRPASKRYLSDMDSRLNRFAKDFQCDIASVRPELVKEWLGALKLSGRSYVNFARAIGTLFNFAKDRKFFPRDVNPLESVTMEFDDEGEIGIFTPAEMAKFFQHAEPEFIPFLAIGAFAGLREAEILRLDWSEVKKDFIEVKKGKAKTRSRRLVPIQPNLAAWLADHRKDFGPVAPFKQSHWPRARMVEASGQQWKDNGLRHSFCSYRFAILKNENEVAMEAGNSPQKLYANYRELVTEADAKAWFAISPAAQPANVVAMKA